VGEGLLLAPAQVAPHLTALDLEEGPGRSRLILLLREEGGRYAPDEAGDAGPFYPGAQVEVALGYRTLSGPMASPGPAFWVEAWERRPAGLEVRTVGAWGLLAEWRTRRLLLWPAGSAPVVDILADLLALVGLDASSASPRARTWAPAFTVSPGESGAEAVGRLLERVPDLLLFRGVLGILGDPARAGVPEAVYGAGRPVLEAGRARAVLPANRVQAFGAQALGEALDWKDLERSGERLIRVHDPDLATPQVARERAQAVLDRLRAVAPAGWLVAPVHPGQKLYDAVEVHASEAGFGGRCSGWWDCRWPIGRAGRPATGCAWT